MVLSPTRDARSNTKGEDWRSLAPECFQENLGSPVKSKPDPKDGPEPVAFVLQDSDLANRQRNSPVSGAKLQEPKAVEEAIQKSPGSPETQPDGHAPRKETRSGVPIVECLAEGGQGSAESQQHADDAEVSRKEGDEHRVDKGDSPDILNEESSKLVHGSRDKEKDSSGEWSDGLTRRKERVVPEETLKRSPEVDDDGGDDQELAPLPFSGPIISAVGYSGPMFSSGGSISRRSDGSSTSTRSFAFPILPGFEWNTSPARMPPPDRRWRRKSWWWCKCKSCCCLCFSQPSTHP